MPTKTPLQSITLTSNVTSVIFSNIDQRYKDLELVINSPGLGGGNNSNGTRFTINGDGSTNYSSVYLNSDSDGTPASGRETSSSLGRIGFIGETLNTTSTLVANFQDYSNTTSYKSVISQSSSGSSNNDGNNFLGVSLWRSTAAINSISLVLSSGGNIAAGSTFDLYGISPSAANNTQAFGGTEIYYDSSYVYHVFKDSGTFTPNINLTADILVIAGGGAGGGASSFGTDGAGGGGAGGLLAFTSQSLTPISYTVTVGAGGSNVVNSSSNGSTGSDSRFGSLTLVKGGGGGGGASLAGSTGGSGGGGGYNSSGGAATSGQGFAGGTNSNNTNGGGGGSAAAGSAGVTQSDGGNGGNGLTTYSSWGLTTNTGQNVSGTVYYAGGGGGASDASTGNAGTGGFGGGGLGMYRGASPAASGTTNTGGGGGGAGAGNKTSGSGGSGIVIVRYAR